MTGMQLTSIFCLVDDFCKKILPEFRKNLIDDGRKFRVRTDCLSESEIITILIWFNLSGLNCFKHFYLSNSLDLKSYFPRIPCYERFVILQKKGFVLMNILLRFLSGSAQKTGVYYIDSTFLQVYKNQRIYHHKTFSGLAQRGFSSCGWFYGFKLHLITNHLGEPVSFAITKGNISDQNMTAKLAKDLIGFLFGDKGYLSARTTTELLSPR